MQIFLARWFQRFFVLVIGVIVAYLSVWQVFPFFDHRLPAAIAFFATYVFIAYVLLPIGLRVWNYFSEPGHIPLYCVTPDGFASDPINIGLVGTYDEVTAAMAKAGWSMADRRTIQTVAKEIVAVLLRRPYPTAPFSSLYLFGRKQDFGFEQHIAGRAVQRHHVRFWACNLLGPEEFHGQVHFWRRFQIPERSRPDRQLWVGAASKDLGIAPIRHNAQITHRVAPDTDIERDLIVHDLRQTSLIASERTIVVGRPYTLRNRAVRSLLRSDGKLVICELQSFKKTV
jgi:hypothetical protein